MLEQSQQDFTISYFCRLILLHNLNDWQSAMEEQKMRWTREGIFLSHMTLLFTVSSSNFQCQSITEAREETEMVHYSAEQSLCVQLLSDWCHCPFYFSCPFAKGLMCSSSTYSLIFQIVVGCAFIHSNCLDFLFFFLFFSQMEII